MKKKIEPRKGGSKTVDDKGPNEGKPKDEPKTKPDEGGKK
jgi:hypothetical protein